MKFGMKAGFLALALVACGKDQSTSQLHTPPLTAAQGLEELHAIVSKVKALYGPLEFKEERFGYTLADLVTKAETEIKAATNDQQTMAAYVRFLMSFRDGHVGIRFKGNNTEIKSYKLPFYLVPVEGKAIVAKVGITLSAQGVSVGQELISIDGQNPIDLQKQISVYKSFGNEVSDRHALACVTNRAFFMEGLLPTQPYATLKFQDAAGEVIEAKAPWEIVKDDTTKFELAGPKSKSGLNFTVGEYAEMKQMGEGSLMQMGAYKPYFATDSVKAVYDFIEVQPSDEYLKKYNVTREKIKDANGEAIYAALYKYNGKTVLLVRQPGYYPETLQTTDLLNGYRAILDQYDSVADVLVIDQNHNPGGSLDYAEGFFSLFINKPALALVQHVNADRQWIYDFNEWATLVEPIEPAFAAVVRARAELVEQAMDQGKSITEPMPLVGFEYVQPDAQYTWKKPILVLADELAGSCGDIFPMYMKRNNIAKIFGERTMGLGGNVEEVITLPYSVATVRMTRGLFTTYKPDGRYTNEELVENNGILPDIHHEVTVNDFRQGFVDYVKAFSEEATKLQ